jgi:type IV pilus assembly protein PilO
MSLLNQLREGGSAQKMAIFVAAVAVVLLLDWSYVYGPRAESLEATERQVDALRIELEAKRDKSNAREEFARELRLLSGRVREAEARLPDEREIADLLSNIASSARAVGLDLTLFRQKPETYADFYARVPVEMNMRGTYHELAQFLDRVKRLDRIVNVADIAVRKPRVQGEVMLVDASCVATTFRFLSEEERRKIQAEQAAQGKKGGKPNVRTGP